MDRILTVVDTMHCNFHLLLLSCYTCCCYGLSYQRVPLNSPVSAIPDPKWHSFENYARDRAAVAANLTSAYPVLRYCAFTEVYRVIFRRGHKPFELLLLLRHTNGEHLVNLTLNNNDNIFVNGKKYIKTKYAYYGGRSEVEIQKEENGFLLWSQGDNTDYISIGNGDWDKAIYEWLYVNVSGRPCYEAKVKVVHGTIQFTVDRNYVAFPTEPYDDVFYTPSTTTITTPTTVPESNVDEDHASSLSPEDSVDRVHKASSTTGVLYVVGGVIVLVATIVLSFVGYRLGCRTARKQALKNGLLAK